MICSKSFEGLCPSQNSSKVEDFADITDTRIPNSSV
jgi:hypothetical protein